MNLLPSWYTDNLFFPCLAVIHALSTLGKPFKCLMNQDSLVTTYTQGSGVDKTDTCTGSQQDLLNEIYNFLLYHYIKKRKKSRLKGITTKFEEEPKNKKNDE